MKQTLILLAGYPGTGKSYLAGMIMERFPEFSLLSPDDFKEKYWDLYGFKNSAEKDRLIELSWDEYYSQLDSLLSHGSMLISDYPFSDKQKDKIQKIAEKYECQIITIRLVGNLDVLFERQHIRDLDNSRHLGHIMQKYDKGEILTSHEEADNLLNLDEFVRRCTSRGYGEFSLGKTVELDVTDFNTAPYGEVFDLIRDEIKTIKSL